MNYCYGGRPRLWASGGNSDDDEDDTTVNRSVTGVQQGYPFGPVLFAINLQPIINKVQQKVAVAAHGYGGALRNPFFLAFYLDDGVLIVASIFSQTSRTNSLS